MAVVNVIVIHGIGNIRGENVAYSQPLQDRIRKHFGIADPHAIAFHEVNWSDIGAAEEMDLINNKHVLPDASLPGAGSLWPPNHALGEVLDSVTNISEQARRFLLLSVGDVLIYLTKAGGELIRKRLMDKIVEVRDLVFSELPRREQRYLSIVANSLGSVVTYDVCALFGTRYRDVVSGLGLSHLFTMGSPLALFTLMQYGGAATHYARRGVYLDRPDGSGCWINFYDQQDPIAFPLRDVYPPLVGVPGREYTIDDRRVQTGTFHAHVNYWNNDVIAREIAFRLRGDYEKDR